MQGKHGWVHAPLSLLDKHTIFFKAGQRGIDGHTSSTRTSRAGSSRPGSQPCVEPILFMCTFVDPDDAVALPAAPPRWAGNSPTPLAASKHRQRLFPNGFQVLIATPGGMEPARGRTARVTLQGHPGADQRPLRAPAQGATLLRPGKPPRPRSRHGLTTGEPCSRQHRELCHRDRGSGSSEKQDRLWPWCSHGRGQRGQATTPSQPPPPACSR